MSQISSSLYYIKMKMHQEALPWPLLHDPITYSASCSWLRIYTVSKQTCRSLHDEAKRALHAQLLQLCLTLWEPMDHSPLGSPVHGIFGKNPGVGCHTLLQGIFPKQGSNMELLRLLHCRHWAPWGSSKRRDSPLKEISQWCHCWHFGPDSSLQQMVCLVHCQCLAASFAFTH